MRQYLKGYWDYAQSANSCRSNVRSGSGHEESGNKVVVTCPEIGTFEGVPATTGTLGGLRCSGIHEDQRKKTKGKHKPASVSRVHDALLIKEKAIQRHRSW